MMVQLIGANFRTLPVERREQMAVPEAALPEHLMRTAAECSAEVLILSTCNRVELYLARANATEPLPPNLLIQQLSQLGRLPAEELARHTYLHQSEPALAHFARVTSSLDSLILGEGQIAGQVKTAFERAQSAGTTGPLLHTLVPWVLRAAKRVRTETVIAQGHVSVSSVAVDYVRQVFDTLADKTILVIGAGKMARLTLTHLRELRPARILVTNRSPDKATELATACGGMVWPWERLDDALVEADIALSTTGATQCIMPQARFDAKVRPRRKRSTLVVLDIAVPRDFDAGIHDGDAVCLFNIDDLAKVREATLASRQRAIAPAEAILTEELRKFHDDWQRRQNGPVIRQLRSEMDRVRAEVLEGLLPKLNGKLTTAERASIESAFRLFQNKMLHGPMATLAEASQQDAATPPLPLIDALRKLFRLGEGS
ncbi:MAG: glutamyl-tRNA reductase [Gemmataceae bacterium]